MQEFINIFTAYEKFTQKADEFIKKMKKYEKEKEEKDNKKES